MASGTLTIDETGNGRGFYQDLHMKAKLAFEPLENPGKTDSDSPTHDVYVDIGGGLTPCGAAWAKKGKSGRVQGQIFYSFTIDDPSFSQSLNLSAFPTGKAKGEFVVVWRRARAKEAA